MNYCHKYYKARPIFDKQKKDKIVAWIWRCEKCKRDESNNKITLDVNFKPNYEVIPRDCQRNASEIDPANKWLESIYGKYEKPDTDWYERPENEYLDIDAF